MERKKEINNENFDTQQSRESRQSNKFAANDGSINRIKLEIEKSRKLIESLRNKEIY